MPIIGLLAVLRTIWTFNEFDDIFLLTGGAAGTGVASVQIYNFLTVQRNVGAAAAQSVIMSLVLVVLLAIYMLDPAPEGENGYDHRARRYRRDHRGRRRGPRPTAAGWTRHHVQAPGLRRAALGGHRASC